MGSSPRGRGKPLCMMRVCLLCGLIPARAGKTVQVVVVMILSPAHPRAGGENVGFRGQHGRWSGSSPRGRGKHQLGQIGLAHQRLIPARAGKTCVDEVVDVAAEGSSPRGRGKPERRCRGVDGARLIPARAGKTQMRAVADQIRAGSSPRGRGKPWAACSQRRSARLIPARAGKTSERLDPVHYPQAHPRAGGENTF